MQIVETVNEGLKRGYTLTILAKDIDSRVEGELKKVAPQIKMPGFRPGKVPANLVRKMHGPQLQAEALSTSVQEAVRELLTTHNLRPAMQPSVELGEGYAFGKDAEVKIALEVLPVVPEPQIDGLKLERLTVEADDEAINEALDRLVGQNKTFEEPAKNRKAEQGDLVVLDFLGKIDGVAFEGGKGESVSIEIGSRRMIPGFEEQVVGLKANDEKTITVTFPANYSVEYLRAKEATFDLTVHAVRAPKAMTADEDFAKSLGLEGLEQLRGLIKGQIEQEHNHLTRTHMKRRLLDQLASTHDFEVPPSMVQAEFDQIWKQLEAEAAREADPEAAVKEMEADREDYHKIAVRRVRLGLLLSEIGQKNGIEISNIEMNRLISQAAQQYDPKDRERFVEYIQQEPMAAAQLRAPLYEDKVVDFLFAKADIIDRTVSRSELESAIEADEEDIGHVHGPDCDHDHDHGKAKPKAKKASAKAEAKAEDGDATPAKKASAKKAVAAKSETADAPAEKPARKAPAKKAK